MPETVSRIWGIVTPFESSPQMSVFHRKAEVAKRGLELPFLAISRHSALPPARITPGGFVPPALARAKPGAATSSTARMMGKRTVPDYHDSAAQFFRRWNGVTISAKLDSNRGTSVKI